MWNTFLNNPFGNIYADVEVLNIMLEHTNQAPQQIKAFEQSKKTNRKPKVQIRKP